MKLDVETKEWLEVTLSRILVKMEQVRERSKDKIPAVASNGVHDDRADNGVDWNSGDGIDWWTNGFWGGILWQLYHHTKDGRYAEIAEISEKKLDKCFETYYGLHHDVGFMWLPTAVANYRLTRNEDSKRRGLLAAQLLAGRFNPAGNFIRAWNDSIPRNGQSNRGWAIIDCMFNIPLLYWASEMIDDPRYKNIAMLHADTVEKIFIRENGSARHIVEFDPVTGKMVKEHGGQGYCEGSAWTRGQSWALYGFTISYQHTKRASYLKTAEKVADYFVSQIPEDGHIPVDFDQPLVPHIEDSTAGAIAACGLLELSELISGKELTYFNAALKLLKTISADRCDFSVETDGLLTHCTGAYHRDGDKEINLTYADYYFIEALLKLNGTDFKVW